MKLVILMYLEEDQACVQELVERAGVSVYSRLEVEGRGEGTPGWLEREPAYASQITMAVVDDGTASEEG